MNKEALEKLAQVAETLEAIESGDSLTLARQSVAEMADEEKEALQIALLEDAYGMSIDDLNKQAEELTEEDVVGAVDEWLNSMDDEFYQVLATTILEKEAEALEEDPNAVLDIVTEFITPDNLEDFFGILLEKEAVSAQGIADAISRAVTAAKSRWKKTKSTAKAVTRGGLSPAEEAKWRIQNIGKAFKRPEVAGTAGVAAALPLLIALLTRRAPKQAPKSVLRAILR